MKYKTELCMCIFILIYSYVTCTNLNDIYWYVEVALCLPLFVYATCIMAMNMNVRWFLLELYTMIIVSVSVTELDKKIILPIFVTIIINVMRQVRYKNISTILCGLILVQTALVIFFCTQYIELGLFEPFSSRFTELLLNSLSVLTNINVILIGFVLIYLVYKVIKMFLYKGE